MLLLILPLPVYVYYQNKLDWPQFGQHWRAACWLLAYLLTITVLSWGGGKEFGGHDYVTQGWDQLTVAVTALLFYRWGVRSGWRTPELDDAAPGRK